MKMEGSALNGLSVVATRPVVGPMVVGLLCCPSRNLSSAGLLVPMGPHVNDLLSRAVIRRVASPTVDAKTVARWGHPEDQGMACGSMELMRNQLKNLRPLTILLTT